MGVSLEGRPQSFNVASGKRLNYRDTEDHRVFFTNLLRDPVVKLLLFAVLKL
jgi:hypothetical protein